MAPSTICHLIQAFPVLLILAQNIKRCLETPLIYKPPSPTHSPEYYEAFEELYQSLFGHGHHGNHGHGTYHDCGHGYDTHGTKYPHYGTPYQGHSPASPPHHGYPQTFYPGYGYPNYYNSKKSLNGSHGYGYKTYAPNQVYKVRNKVVIKKNVIKHQKLTEDLKEEICTTIDQTIGNCVALPRCTLYMNMLQDPRNKQQAFQILRRAHCGFEGSNPKVCCPRPSTPPKPAIQNTRPIPARAPKPPRKSGRGDFVSELPDPPVCGSIDGSLKRVFTQSIKIDTFPWLTFLGYKSRQSSGIQWLCGGSLITSKHILTAAHCIHGYEKDLVLVRFFETKSGRVDGVNDIPIKAHVKHEQFNPADYGNDIGLLVLDKDVTFTASIKPICIPKDSELRSRNFQNYHPIVAAWSESEISVGQLPTELRVSEVPVLSNDMCQKTYSPFSQPKIDERVLCAGFKSGERDACDGDSGAPLMQPITNQQRSSSYYQTGIVSFGKNCAVRGFPGVYTRVTYFVPWIVEKVTGTISY